MKTGWQQKPLREVAEVASGNPAPQGNRFFVAGTQPLFRTSDAGRIHFGGICDAADHLNEAGIKRLRRFPSGTILFPKSGASTFLNHRVILERDGFVSSHLAAIVADETKIHSRFLLYFLSTICAQEMIQDHAYPSVNLGIITGIRVPLPNVDEQRRIVGILDEAFQDIDTARANAEKNVQNARDIFESQIRALFSSRDKSWVEKKVSELVEEGVVLKPFDVNHGELHPRRADYVANGVPFVMASDLQDRRADTVTPRFISRSLPDSLRTVSPTHTYTL